MNYNVSDQKMSTNKKAVSRLGGMNERAKALNEVKKAFNMVCDDGRLRTRERRAKIRTLTKAQGICADDTLAYVDNGYLYYGGQKLSSPVFTATEKQIFKLGNYLLVFPDGIYINTQYTYSYGYLFATYSTPSCAIGRVDESLTDITYNAVVREPEEANIGDHCAVLDEHGKYIVKRFNGESWVQIKTYIRIRANNIGIGFRDGDYIMSSGFDKIGLDNFIIYKREDMAIYTEGVVFDTSEKIRDVTISRYIPRFDFVTVSGDRLVGVRRGIDIKGRVVCKMYASAMHDPFNFSVSTGGLEASLNISGAFTGVCDYMGSPIAFTENEIIETRVKNGALIASVVKTHGVESGAHKSIVCANGKLYYKSRAGVCEYDGSYPECISRPIGEVKLSEDGAPAGFVNGKYYIKLTDNDSQNTIYVYNTENSVWYSEDDPAVVSFACRGGNLYAVCRDGTHFSLVLFDYDSATENEKNYIANTGFPQPDQSISWEIESADIGMDNFDSICPVRAVLRLRKPAESTVSVGVIYNGSEASEKRITLTGGINGAVVLPIPLRRCDTFRLSLRGVGECEVLGYGVKLRQGGYVYGWR